MTQMSPMRVFQLDTAQKTMRQTARQLADTARKGIGALLARVRGDSLLRNSVYIMATTVVTSLLGYLYWILAAHLYPAHAVGLASTLISALMLTANFANLGVGAALTQRLPRCTDDASWSLALTAGMLIGVSTSLLCGPLVMLAVPLLSNQFAELARAPAYQTGFVVGVSLWVVATILDQVFIAERSAKHMLARNTIFSLLKLGLLPLAVAFGANGSAAIFVSFVVAAAGGVVVAVALLVPRLGRRYRFSLAGQGARIREMLSSLAGHHLINVGGLAPMFLLPVIVTTRLSAAGAAYFYATWMVGGIFFIISPAVSASLFAEGSHVSTNIGAQVRSSAAIIGALLVPLMLAFLIGGQVIMALFGADYAVHSRLLLTLLVLSAVPDAITNIYTSVLRVRRRVQAAAGLNLGMALIALILAWLLVPAMGVAGAGWGWLWAQVAGCLFVGAHMLWGRCGAIRAQAYARGGVKRTTGWAPVLTSTLTFFILHPKSLSRMWRLFRCVSS